MRIATMPEADQATAADEAGLGALRTEAGNLPLERLDVRVDITGLVSRVELSQDFRNVHDRPLEATYVFPLPDRAAVTAMRMTADGRVVQAELRERAEARQTYDDAIASGQRAAIAEEERPDVFTMRVGNIRPGERVSVTLTLAGPLAWADGEATFRFPLVVAPRYVPGRAYRDEPVGDGYAPDTDAVPDASRITPPVLLPGFPDPVRLSIDVGVDAAGLPLHEVRSSLHAVETADGRLRIRPGERVDRDFVLRLPYRTDQAAASLVVSPDPDGEEGTFRLTVLPPEAPQRPRPRDVVLLLDRSGSMGGWKMVAARRAAARIVDTLVPGDRFAVLAFDHVVETPPHLPSGLVPATDRNRYRAIEHLARMEARGGTELLRPLRDALALLDTGDATDRVLVLVTDGQVGNEDQLLHEVTGGLRGVRVHTVGIDRAVNAGFLGRLAVVGGGRCELVESEDRLDEAMDHIHRRIGSPAVTAVRLADQGLSVLAETVTPARLPDVFPGVPFVVSGRYRGAGQGTVTVHGTTRDGREFAASATAERREAPALTAIWARAHLRDLEDAAAAASGPAVPLEQRITATSLRFGVLCRFTAYVAVDSRVVADGGAPQRIIQPVELPSGWAPPAARPAPPGMSPAAFSSAPPAPAGAPMPVPPGTAMRRAAAPMRAAGGGFGGPTGGPSGPDRSAPPAPPVGLPPAYGSVAPVAPGPRAPEPADDLRTLAATEARRLREAQDRPDYERRELLEDLGSRLAVLGAGPLRALAEALASTEIARRELTELWEHCLRTLDEYAAGRPVDPPRSAVRRAFWKR